ncbi:hypothetical protein PVAP13_3KG415600 [Panicum virgatum]|uniref:Uncharacterized protein n=1 Tax=Panicum virgatum TaxID=38727 RepID=A0A8T0VA47_PANVG|nr:hypothetical protein PVAP13_3KG415600 [Panicum virgatum]
MGTIRVEEYKRNFTKMMSTWLHEQARLGSMVSYQTKPFDIGGGQICSRRRDREIGCVASKNDDFRKIPLKELVPVRYNQKIEMGNVGKSEETEI